MILHFNNLFSKPFFDKMVIPFSEPMSPAWSKSSSSSSSSDDKSYLLFCAALIYINASNKYSLFTFKFKFSENVYYTVSIYLGVF